MFCWKVENREQKRYKIIVAKYLKKTKVNIRTRPSLEHSKPKVKKERKFRLEFGSDREIRVPLSDFGIFRCDIIVLGNYIII